MSARAATAARLRIAWICGSRIVGGAERATLAVLGGLHERGHAIAAVYPPGGALEPALQASSLAGAALLHPGMWHGFGYRAIRRALEQADVALVTGIDQWAPALLARRPHGARIALVRHMALPVSPMLRWLAERRADLVIAVSAAVREQLLGRLGIAAARIQVVHNPVRLPICAAVPDRAARAHARRRLGVPASGHCAAFLGGYVPAKGLADALVAVQAASQHLGATQLLICGSARDAAERAGAERQAAALGIAAHCRHLGMIDAVADVLTAADVLLVPTHRALSEGLPLVVLEAMACGTPVIAYAVGGIPEALGDPHPAGYLVPPDAPEELAAMLLAALSDAAEASRRATAALERARTVFDRERIVAQYEQLLRAVCEGRA